ncbi:type VI secretion system Vgr family protein [Anaeromicropila populeti]|uniref:Phage late control gene D protein (GPD) n=1 Tax=Anaeromicropila populeti TaxID=37658 RepID=A0A1I6HTK3_9FIRM|nr:contractile injection system protein, VgrG/Pvc8 family [Anaeromicropila populeti]SFR57792.1 Phage late control gene D protein (GPD) [Anaeromicropila populeti]
MAGITYLEIKTNWKEIQEIEELNIMQEINEHGRLELTGVLVEQNKDSLVTQSLEGKEIEVYAEQDTQIVLFKGLIQEAAIHMTGGLYTIRILGITYSILTDTKKKNRSFQDIGMTYTSLVNQMIKDYDKGVIKDLASGGKAIETLLVQYQETDWEFFKRLASHFNMGILPSLILEGPKIMFGTYEGKDWGNIDCHEYTLSKNLLDYKQVSENTFPALTEQDVVEYEIDVLDCFEIGEKVTYQGKSYRIKRKQAVLVQDMLRFRYVLSSQRGLGKERIYASQLKGVSLKGTVIKSVQDKVKVHLEIDPEQAESTAFLFPYTTVYTAEGQSGWYCMPEAGDTVLIYFPSGEEGQAVGMNSYRTGEKGTAQITDPKTKYFRTADGKELKFSPEEIVITCIQGKDPKTGENKTIYIKLNQTTGIEIKSTLPVQITSNEGVSITAEEKVEITASESISLRCKKSQIKMDSKVDICGPEVRIN